MSTPSTLDPDAVEAFMLSHENCFYDGPDDPLYAAAAQFQVKIDAEIEAAGGVEAWRARGVATTTAA